MNVRNQNLAAIVITAIMFIVSVAVVVFAFKQTTETGATVQLREDCLVQGDWNCDGVIDMSDAVGILQYIFNVQSGYDLRETKASLRFVVEPQGMKIQAILCDTVGDSKIVFEVVKDDSVISAMTIDMLTVPYFSEDWKCR